MKDLTYTLLPAVGPDEEEASGTVVDLLRSIPYLLIKRIPPLAVINRILEQGEVDAGMSGGARWKPFSLSEEEYEVVVDYLEDRGLVKIKTPEWVQTEEDWAIWQMEVDHGVPAAEHRRLHQACADIEARLKQAEKTGNDEQMDKLHIQYLEASNKLVVFTEKYLTKK